MAKVMAVPYKRGEKASFSPKDIRFDEEKNGRAFLYKKSDFEDLLRDLRSGKGITSPLWVRSVTEGEGQVPMLVAGQRRLHAALEYLKENPDYLIPCIWVNAETEREILELNIRENAPRKNLSIIDIGHNACRLRDLPTTTGGNTMEEIGQQLGVSQAQVTQAIKIVEGLPEVVQRLIHDGKVTNDDALTVLKVPDPTRREQMIQEFLSGKPKAPAPTSAAAPAGASDSAAPSKVTAPEQPKGQAERPMPTEAAAARPERNVRDAARDAGAKVALRMPELKRYLQEALDEEGPGSNKGEVQLKKKLLAFVNGEITSRTIDDWFNKCCKIKGHE